MSSLCAQCPAAAPVAGVDRGSTGIVCRLAQAEVGRTDQILHGASAKPFYRARDDASIIIAFCCGTALPMVDREKGEKESRAHHTYCPVWLAEHDRVEERKRMMIEPEAKTIPSPGTAGPMPVTDDDMADLLELKTPEERHAYLG